MDTLVHLHVRQPLLQYAYLMLYSVAGTHIMGYS